MKLLLRIFALAFIVSILIVLIVRVNHSTQVSAAQEDYEYKRAITLTYSGSTLTNHDVVFTLDTASLISAEKMQSDCDDIRIYDSDESTPLSYWIESGCNTANTQIWTQVPSIPDGGKTIYAYYGYTSDTNGEESWAGNFTLLYNNTCPSGWTQNSTFDSRFPRGSATYGSTGGASSHTHDPWTGSTGSGGNLNATVGSSGAVTLHDKGTHTHTVTVTHGTTTDVLPPYLGMVYCYKNQLDINSGLIGMFTNTPTGWTQFSALDDKFPYGATSYGATGGDTTHTHTATRTSYNAGNTTSCTCCGSATRANTGHTSNASSTDAGTSIPEYLAMIFSSADSDTQGTAGMITIVDVLPPLGWTRFSALDDKFPYGATSYGATGGTNTHTHATSYSEGAGGLANCAGGSLTRAKTHSHSVSYTTASASNIPPYATAIFAQRNTPSATTSVGSEISTNPSCQPALGDSAHSITKSCSFAGYTDANNESNIVSGLDSGTGTTNTSVLTIETGTLTINANETLVLGSMELTGGSMVVADGAVMIIGGNLWAIDADGDGYPEDDAFYAQIEAPTNGVRLNTIVSNMSTVDCSDNDASQNTVCTLTVDLMEYSSDANARATYITNADAVTSSGGTITYYDGYTIHTFASNGNFGVPGPGEVEYLLVGGGGGGSSFSGGGGGSGGFITNTGHTVTQQTYTIVIGDGGSTGVSGSDSTFSTLTATGGGNGITGGAGGNGGCGGGGGRSTPYTGGIGSQGGDGGDGRIGSGDAGSGNPYCGGGGGGASANGTNATSGGPGSGGIGTASSISGSSVTYAGGGGAGADNYRLNAVGSGGGGGGGGGGSNGLSNNGSPAANGTAGTTNRGGGGGGGNNTGAGAAGGSGIVIIRYRASFESFYEATIINQGLYSLKGVADTTYGLNKTLTRTVSPTIDLSNNDHVKFDIRSNRTGSNIKIGLHDAGGTTTEITPNITSADQFQNVSLDLSSVSNMNKDAIDSIIITIVNADADNTFYIDNMISILYGS
jgi:hypothetical protein